MKNRFNNADALLLITTTIWGSSFIIVKWAINSIDPYFFIFSRFFLALVVLLVFLRKKVFIDLRVSLRPGVMLGCLLGLAFISQTLGLKYTTASNSGFITGLNVVFVPVFAAVLKRHFPKKIVFAGIVSAAAGILLITMRGPLAFKIGDLLTLACAALFAIHIIYTEHYARGRAVSSLVAVQFTTVSLLCLAANLFAGGERMNPLSFSTPQWFAILYCGILGTAMAYLFQTKAQQKIPPFRTAILLATEPLFAGIIAMGFEFDPFDWRVVAGGMFIFAGMILACWDVKNN